MVFTRTVLASALLTLLPVMACHAALDLTYTAPEPKAVPSDATPQPKSLFPMQTLPPLKLEYSCEGPQCQYETDIDKRHEDQTTRHWSIGIQ
ncbi:hypothetical protein K2E96_14965 [Pseudomonas sp. ERGC3:05]|jgi:hypothetical protein|uniref:hypothetical protein n=1 Tax=Pseudomonas TaxID=286 RepID=UPI001C864C7B|nr:hypothetical protein [Pseudomonas fluorescens]MBX7277389.1 hypothetical protein [Pseudomonas sp. ERGC3:01]QZC97072.1 hypothetical protein K2E96_14965 [Pseudomonas sp. ERGC3:05]UXV17794.1 hypothetical protein N4P55_18105 [Pseudomonas fluorescens]